MLSLDLKMMILMTFDSEMKEMEIYIQSYKIGILA
jgi:hypothetical protein